MSFFRRQIEADISQVFLNLSEFGEWGEIGGRAVRMATQALAFEPSPSGERVSVAFEGITVFVAASDLPDELLASRRITFNGEPWFINDSRCEMGLKVVELYRERS